MQLIHTILNYLVYSLLSAVQNVRPERPSGEIEELYWTPGTDPVATPIDDYLPLLIIIATIIIIFILYKRYKTTQTS